MDVLRKSLETIALGYSQGNCSIDKLIKACNNYKIKKGFVDDINYDIIVAKSCIDFINGIPQDKELVKAIIPGQTKVVDGVMYIYSKTKSGSKEEYGWHVVRKGNKTKQDIGGGSKLTADQLKAKQKYVNDLFPNDLSTLTEVKKLGGSTGAVLVKDADGNEYVLKKGKNTSSAHVKAEYLSNQLYGILGVSTPDYELYEDNGETILLSRFIQGTRMPQSSDFSEMGKNFISDVLLANWDVYQNDNCLIQSATGKVFRVDNGSCLDWRARGSNKVFDENVLKTFNDMKRYNPGIANQLDDDNILQQIQSVIDKKDDLINYLTEIGEDEYTKTLSKRIDNLKQISDNIRKDKEKRELKAAVKLGKMPKRVLKSDADMYADLTSDDVDELLDDTKKETGYDFKKDDGVLYAKNSIGAWALLTNICDKRGFNARPDVVTEKEFWKLRKNTKHPLMFRGNNDQGGKSGADYCDEFRYADVLHYGGYGIWGQGIYAHSDDVSNHRNGTQKDNNSDEHNFKSSRAYSGSESALAYAGGSADGVLKMMWSPDANVVDSDVLLDEIKKSGGAGSISPKLKKMMEELEELKKEWTDSELQLVNLSDIIKKQVFDQIGYDENTAKEMLQEFDDIDWNVRNAQGKRSYPMFQEFVVKKVKPWFEACGGKAEIINEGEDDEQIRFAYKNQELYISKYAWENNAVKQKNAFARAYHFQAERFLTFFDTNIVKTANDALQKENASGKISGELKDKVSKKKQEYYDKKKEVDDESNKVSGDDIYSRIYRVVKDCDYRDSGNRKSLLGIYAALKGYDGIYQKDGNGSGHGFTIILNRSKIITSVE